MTPRCPPDFTKKIFRSIYNNRKDEAFKQDNIGNMHVGDNCRV